jgi:polyhydroxyalkanoate synthesis regulator phasin
MLEEIRKGLLSGFGAVLLTKEKAEEATRKLVEDAKISKEDAQTLIDELFETGTRQWSEIEASLSKTLHKGIDNLDIASKKELHGLKSKMGKLEKRVETLEQRISNKQES